MTQNSDISEGFYTGRIHKPLKALLLDLDNTLANTSVAFDDAAKDWCIEQGLKDKEETFDRLKNLLPSEAEIAALKEGESIFGKTAYFIKRVYDDLPFSAQEIALQIEQKCMEKYITTPLEKGAREFIEKAKAKGLKIALFTQAPPMQYIPLLTYNNALGLFDVFCDSEEAGKGKKHPDIFMLASQKLQVDLDECLLIDDSKDAITTAKQLNVLTVGMLSCLHDVMWMKREAYYCIYNFGYKDSKSKNENEKETEEEIAQRKQSVKVLEAVTSDDFISGRCRESLYFREIALIYGDKIKNLNKQLANRHIPLYERNRIMQEKQSLIEVRNAYEHSKVFLTKYTDELADDVDFAKMFNKLVIKLNTAMRQEIPFRQQDESMLFSIMNTAVYLRNQREKGFNIKLFRDELEKQAAEFIRFTPSQRELLALPAMQQRQRQV